MRNIRLYIGGKRADLDESTSVPFTFQTTDAEMPTAVKNSYSKTITLQGTDTNRRIFDGLWRLDSLVTEKQQRPPEYIPESSESDAEFTERNVPSVAVGDMAKVLCVKGKSVVWNQLVENGDFTSTTGWTRNSSYAPFSVSDNTATVTVSTATRNAMIYTTLSFPNGHKIYYSYRLKITAQTARTIWTSYVYPSPYQYEPSTSASTSDFSTWKRASGVFIANGDKTRLYVGAYGYTSADTFAVGDTVEIQSVMAIDLTAMGLDSLSVSDFEALYPLDYYDYNTGQLVSNSATGIEMLSAGDASLGTIPLNITDLVPANKPTLRLNQLIKKATINATSNGVTLSNSGTNTFTLNGLASANGNFYMSSATYIDSLFPANHYIYYNMSIISGSFTGTIRFGGAYAGKPDIGAQGVSIITKYTSTNYPTLSFLSGADITSLKFHLMAIDLTEMYGSGNEPTSSAVVEELIGGYVEPTTGTDIPNRIYPKGAKSAGTACDVIRQTDTDRVIGVVDLGTLTWTYSNTRFKATLNRPNGTMNLLCTLYQPTSLSTTAPDKTIYAGSYYGANIIAIYDSAYTDAATFKAAMSGVYLYYELATPEHFDLLNPLSDTPVPFSTSGKQRRLPQDTASSVLAPFIGSFEYGRIKTYPLPYSFNPMKRVDFQLFVDEMVVERGYCQLAAINRKGRDYTFSVSLFGGLGEFFYNLQTDSDGEKRSLADLDYGSDLGFKINATEVQSNWDTLLGGTLPSIAFVPMHNGVPKTISGDKMLIKGGGLPTSTSDGFTTKSGYLLASLERKYTEWEVGDLRSYLQRPALRVKDFIDAICDPANNGGWRVNLDSDFFDSANPYYWNTYLLLPQLNVEEETEDICDDGSITPLNDYPTTSTKTKNLTPVSGCMPISSNYVDMSAYASNAYLKLSLPVQLALTGQANVGNLYMTNRVSHHTENKTICVMAAAWDEEGNMVGVSNRYVFTSKSHRNETGDVKKPSAPYPTTDAQIDGYFAYSGGEYKFRLDDYNSDTFALAIDKIQRPSSALHKVRVDFYIQMTTEGIPTLNKYRRGDNVDNVYVSNTQFDVRILSGSNNTLTLVEPTQYATDSQVSQDSLFGALEATPLEILLSYTKRFGLMWIQENSEKEVSVFARKNYYTGEVKDIHNLIDYSKGLKVTPVAAESNNYILGDKETESTLAEAYLSRYGRNYGEVRLKVGYDFGKEKVEMMEKCEFTEVVDGALSGSGYWAYRNADGNLPSAIADGMKVTYYKESGGVTDTKDLDYNLFNVTGIEKKNSPALGCASKTDDGEETAEEVAPALVFFQGGKVDGTWHLTDDNTAMALLNNSPCWLWDESLAAARVPRFGRVATFSGETYSLDFGTPRETFYIPEVSLAPEQAIYARWWERYLIDLLSKDTKKAECYVVFPPHLDMRNEMRKFYLFDRSLWVLNKVTDYDATKVQPVKCEFIRVTDKEAYTSY